MKYPERYDTDHLLAQRKTLEEISWKHILGTAKTYLARERERERQRVNQTETDRFRLADFTEEIDKKNYSTGSSKMGHWRQWTHVLSVLMTSGPTLEASWFLFRAHIKC